MSFPPFILPRLTVVSPCTDAAVQLVVDPCNIALYLHSKNPKNPYTVYINLEIAFNKV